jgi:putative Ca2+/H+ antiporter (TMEM165/GDT1 family)
VASVDLIRPNLHGMATEHQTSTGARRAGQPAPAAEIPADWPVQAADAIERVVGGVRDKTTGPAITLARGVVYGTFAAIIGIAVLTMLAVIAVRVLDVYLPESVTGDENTWLAHLIVGIVFCLLGMFSWAKRSRRAA